MLHKNCPGELKARISGRIVTNNSNFLHGHKFAWRGKNSAPAVERANLNRTATATDLGNDLGAGTTVDLSLTSPNGWGGFNGAYDDTPIRGGIDDYTGTSNPTSLTFSDLNATFPSGYKAIVYVGGFNGNNGASISDGSSTYHYKTIASPSAPVTFVGTTDTTDDGTGTAPDAQYAVFGSTGTPLTADSITCTVDTLYGGGAAIGGVQIVGEAAGGTSHKTPIPVPVPTPKLSINGDLSLHATELEDDGAYEVEGNDKLSGIWSPLVTIPSGAGGTWSGPGPGSGDRHFYRLAYPGKTERFVLPLTAN